MDKNTVLEVKNLKTYFHIEDNIIKAVDDVSFYVLKGETLGIVGESGCGKSVSCMSIVKLIETPPGKYEDGEILFNDRDMLKISDRELRSIRGNDISFIFQEPMTSLNPVFKVGEQLSETMILHRGMTKKEAHEESINLLNRVRIPNPERIINDYPFALSGGMRQRVMIAMALACEPKLLIADEPTTALDVTIQAQVLELMNELKNEIDTSIIFITHDLGVISEMCDRVMVMYAGKVAEVANVETIFGDPKHPYTIGLINSKPDLNTEATRLNVIPGNVPDLNNMPTGCPFHPRCTHALPICSSQYPDEIILSAGHVVSCWLYSSDINDGGSV
ncbi:MAG: ABC transporter ATP-binding protein [Oscillospiraceae bacterium]|nr:ABC transporter ATP-binding protein [Oscillospiraceae bacterium]